MSDEGFIGRWSKRKAAAREGAVDEQQVPKPNTSSGAANEAKMPQTASGSGTLSAASGEPAVELPSIESLTNDSDYTPFMARSVSPDIRNQAVKKLFTDPHYNIMDGLDTYIDDYSNQEPLPAEWLKILVAASKPASVEETSVASKSAPSPAELDSGPETLAAAEESTKIASSTDENDALQQVPTVVQPAGESLDSAVQQTLK